LLAFKINILYQIALSKEYLKRIKEFDLKIKELYYIYTMEATPIEFCNTIGFILKNNKDKSNILSEIKTNYNIDPIQTNTINFSETANHTSMINRFPYIASLITRGNKFLMYFTRIMGENTVLMIDRKIKKEENIIYPKIISICIQANNDLFDGTILETETILDKNIWTIQFTDIIAKSGNYCNEMHIFDRINTMFDILNNIKLDKYLNPFKIKIKEFYDICELKELKAENSIGIYFHPLNGKHKTIEYNLKGFKDFKQNIELINYDIKIGLSNQLDELKENSLTLSNFTSNDIINKIKDIIIIGQVEITDRFGIFKVKLIKGKELVEIGTIRFESLENKEEFYNKLIKYKTVRLVLKYDYEFKKWIPTKQADKLPFSNISIVQDILEYEKFSFDYFDS